MSCRLPPEIREYIDLVESGHPRPCKEQIALCEMITRIFQQEELFVDEQLLARYLGIQKYWPFDLFPWEKFLFTLWNCTFDADGDPRWRVLFALVARGAGKDGYMAFDAMCSVSPYNRIKGYNVDICANNEDQAMQPVQDVVDVLETPQHERKMNRHYYHTKEVVQGRANRGKIIGHTNSPKGRDGLRSSKVLFNEVHAYQNYDNIKVFTTGLGKREHPRIGVFSSNGDVSDGPLDDYIHQGERILFEGEPDNGFLPFLCRLPTKDAVHDPENWYMANPSLQYRPSLLRETEAEYADWLNNPERNGDFLTKRMNIRAGFAEISVTDYEKILRTKKERPDLSGWSCVAGFDYAELSDWASVLLLFRKGEERITIHHSWICRDSKTLPRIKAPWKKWCEEGLCTYVEDVTINPKLPAEFIAEAAKRYNVRKLSMDRFRWTLVASALREIGFDADNRERVKLIRPSDIMQIEPVIQDCFDRDLFNWGDDPVLRWATNNTKRVRSSKKAGVDTGNYIYAKIEGKSRKTDPFMALVAAMCVEETLGIGVPLTLPPFGAIGF